MGHIGDLCALTSEQKKLQEKKDEVRRQMNAAKAKGDLQEVATLKKKMSGIEADLAKVVASIETTKASLPRRF